ncbi:MAG: hypothetical protein ACI4PF_04110, partial [Christensenellales bacterium]
YEDGIVSTGNNSFVDIELALSQNFVANNSTVETNIAGGLVGISAGSTISNVQVVCNITTVVRANLGGLVGAVGLESVSTKVNEIDNAYVIPKIVANLNTTYNGTNTMGLNIGGVIGVAGLQGNTKYQLKNTIINFIDIGEEQYSWQDRTNIFVFAPNEKVSIGGLIGKENARTQEFKYNYVRSYYERDIDNNYQGNIYVIASSGSVGGLVGESFAGSGITFSYYDGDITASESLNTGMLIGSIANNFTLQYSYAIGLLNDLILKDIDEELVNVTTPVTKVDGDSGIFGSITYGETLGGSDIFGSNIAYVSTNQFNSFNTYGVINGYINYFAEGDKVYGINCKDAEGNPTTITSVLGIQYIYTFLKDTLSYKITLGEDPNLTAFQWFWYNSINSAKVGDRSISYPILLKDTNVMFDLVPSSISAKINERFGLYNITYDSLPQVIMYLNRYTSGSNDKTYYEISLNNENSAFEIKLDGAVVSTTYINANNLKLNDRVEFLENSNEGVIKIVGNKIYPVSIGLATLTIRSYVVKSVKLAINIIVVDGLTDYSVIADNSTLTPTEKAITGEEEVEFNKIYIDEQISININAINKDSNYIANSNFGVILEILDATDGTNTNNGIIKINGTEYSYNSDIEKNIILLNARDFKVSGVKLGIVKLSITPFIILDGVTYVDTYKSLTGIYQKDYNNIYILNKNANINTNLQKTYYFEVLARARSIENTRTDIALDSSNKVLFTTILETANLQIEEDRENNLATITILEDLFISINNKKFNATLNLKDITFDCTIVNNQYICDSSEFKSKVFGYEFDYTLINITFNDLVIVKTNTDVQARNNTYKISFNGYITFDRDFYRTNADMFDLNSAQFTFKITPKSNENISASTLVKIVPNEISTIFTNFYTKGEGSLNGEQIEYPEENESKFIVPGREGLLKITLDEEFNNSSYVTVTLDKKYFGYVTMQQLSAIVDAPANDNETGDILGYRNVISLEQINNNSYFGIRLSKLSLNYNDIHYFNNTYYIKILVNTSIQLSSLDLKITSYSVNDNVASEQYSNTCSLEIIELPKIKVTLEGEDYSVLGKGVRKELDIDYKGLTKNIEFSIIEKTDNKDYSDDFVYITDKEGNKVNELNLEYLNNGYKYYLNQDVLTPSGCEIEILFNADELILGVLETSKCTLYVDTVDFEIDEVKFCGTNNMLYLKFGENMMIDTQIIYRDIVVGVAEDINNFKENELKELIKLVQYEFAGIKWSELVEGKEQIKTNGKLKLQHRKTINNKIEFVDIELGSYGGITISQDLRLVGNYAYEFYEIIGTEISNDTYIRLDIDYYYNNGKLVIGDDALYVYNKTIDIQVIVEDNSTYDHPTPVEDQAKLLSICSVEKGNFILVNNIELKDWVPQEAKFDTLDGNGYTIKINSFDFSTIRGTTSANAGIFSTVSENTLLKNLTIDISPLLKSATALTNDVAIMRASSKNNYTYREDIIDLGYTNELNFGIIAGTNSGAITNAKVVCTVNTLEENKQDKYLHILTTQGYDNNKLIVSNIGGLVGVNAESGAISNSFIGVNISNTVTTENGINYYINGVVSPSSTPMDNQSDELSKIQIYPFTLAGGNNIGGLACINNGIISNCYAKGLGVFNTFPTVGDSATAGLVTYNNNVITSTFVEGNEIKNYRAEDNDFRLESTGYIGGLVYENNATIENSYSNVFVQTLSSFMGGFVFVNNANGTILNCYSTAVNRNSLATGQFTGVKQGVLQNFGSFTNCYYLVDSKNGEFANINEDAIEINNASTKFDDAGTWNGFAFVAGANVDGIWTIESGQTPRLASTLTDTNSFRRLIETVTDFENGNGVTFNYVYDTYYLGTKENPLIIDKAENFDKYIIDSAYEIEDKNIFGYRESENATRYVRIVNNLDFENITTAQEHKGLYLYKVTFVGVLDGNGMTLSNLNINTDSTELDNFGLFAQIGYEKSTMKAVVKNLNMSVRTFKSNGNKKTGILAGTIVNASIINVKIDGGNQTVSGLHMSGSLAGLIYATNNLDVSLIDVSIQNVRVEATHGSLGGTISERSEDKSRYFFNSFSVEREGQQSTDGYSFASLYNSETNSTNLFGENDNSNNVSYAGGVAGVILANNYNKEILDNNYSNYRTNPNESTIDNVIVCGNIVVSTADNAGGLFGYIGENTLIRNSKFVVSDGQLLKAFNFIGGIVGENHGIIEECTVAYSEIEQKEFDATILSDDRENGTFNLFDMSSGEPYYVVSIGGIAGYSKNGVILDSYVKVNVIKSLSYIAGGIVGYSEGYNYLGYVYNTGTVYGKYIIGGIIGLQINDGEKSDDNLKINNSIKMDQVISLTNWNAQSDTLNIRDNITKILFDNEKLLYQKDGSLGYDNFFIKMPEIGNLPINYFINSETGDNEPETIENNYRIGHTSYYVGSVVGKSLLRNTTNSGIVNGDTTDIDVYASYDLVYQLYANAKGVFSSTLGLMTTEGTIESGTRNDDYFKTNFTINGGEDNQINSLSYRIAYPTELNNYSPVENTDGDIKYLDKLNFNKVFTSQEYIQQLLGEYYSIEDGEGASKNTRNIFRYGTKETSNDDGETIINRYESGDIGVFPNADANVWDMADYLPTYASGVTTSIEKVIDEDDLNKAFSNSSSGKTYKILNDIEITYNETGSRYIQYYGGIKSLFVGENSPTITINLSDKSKTEPTKIATIFNIFNGAVLQNINFVINVNKTNFENSKIDTENYGILANTLDGVQITNCSFTIKVENNNEDEDKKIITYNNSVFNATNTAVLFGAVNNSTISRSTFSISA